MTTVEDIIKGYGPDFPSLDQLLGIAAEEADRLRLSSPTPELGRYLKSVSFLQDVTSQRAVGRLRFKVLAEYFVQLSELMDEYDGVHKDRRVVHGLTDGEKDGVRRLARSDDDIVRAEMIEKFAEHDTAAAGDYLKILIGTEFPRLKSMLEGVHFANTSEDVMANVFGMIGNTVVYGLFVPKTLELMETMMNYAELCETERPLVVPAETHRQPAEPTTFGKKIINRVAALEEHIQCLIDGERGYRKFSGKLGGAVGNLTTHVNAYRDIDWLPFARRFVEGFGLHYSELTDQCVSYAREANILAVAGNMMTQIDKVADDFISNARAGKQLFVKKKKLGQKGSSIMPNKSNAWQMEGARKMLRKSRELVQLYAKELQDYPHEGDMGRSYLCRDLGGIFVSAFIALSRIQREMQAYVPHQANIDRYFDTYPGMAGSSMQTILKREGAGNDPYRMMQQVALNPDGSSANSQQFRERLQTVLEDIPLRPGAKNSILAVLDPAKNIGLAHLLQNRNRGPMRARIEGYKSLAAPYQSLPMEG